MIWVEDLGAYPQQRGSCTFRNIVKVVQYILKKLLVDA